MDEQQWRRRQRVALLVYAPWIGLAWGALAGLLIGRLAPWPIAQTLGAIVGALAGWRFGRRVSASRSS